MSPLFLRVLLQLPLLIWAPWLFATPRPSQTSAPTSPPTQARPERAF